MPFEIQPLHIGLILAVAIISVSWLVVRKNRHVDEQGKNLANDIRKGRATPAQEQLLPNAIEQDEPEAPTIDQQAQTEAVEPVVIAEPQGDAPAEQAAPEPEPIVAPVREIGRSAPDIDAAVEAVVHFTPMHGIFDADKIREVLFLYENRDLRARTQMDFFDQDSGLWFHDPANVTHCTQIYLTMLLAQRGYQADEYESSNFIGLVNQMMSGLDAECALPDSFAMTERAKQVSQKVALFNNQLTLKLVSAKDITPDDLAPVAKACGFVAHDSGFEKAAAGSREPVMLLEPSKNLKNELKLSLDVPLIAAANDPLAAYFAVANDLCCRIDAVTTDEQGNPVGPAEAAYIAAELGRMHNAMAAQGVPAGSRRALNIFSRA